MPNSVSNIVAASDPQGEVELVRQLGQEAKKGAAAAIVLLGSLTPKNADPKRYGAILGALAEAGLPGFYLPGLEDAPFAKFLREAPVSRSYIRTSGAFTERSRWHLVTLS